MIFGGLAVVVVIVLLVVMNRGGDDANTSKKPETAPSPTPVAAPAAPRGDVKIEGAKAGKTPGRPAPALTQDTLNKTRELIDKAKGFYNEGVTARNAGDNTKARERQGLAKASLDEAQALLAEPMRWQEEAQMEDWAQPGEYITLEKLCGEISRLEKSVRMGGGK